MSKENEFIEVQFKGNRKGIFWNATGAEIERDDYVIVQAEHGEDLGYVTQKGRLVKLKCGKTEDPSKLEFKVLRPATEDDVKKLEEKDKREGEAFETCRRKIGERNLPMKLVDVEFQFDKSKITFYFTAEQRVDFRELVKDLASIYHTRIELRQIGVRDEAKRVGGYGICGCHQCCCSYIKDFEQITTHMARVQQLSLNPVKISGNCGRLLCCLRHELPFYEEVAGKCPLPGSKVKTAKGEGFVTHTNIFNETVNVKYAPMDEEKVGCADCTLLAPPVPRERHDTHHDKSAAAEEKKLEG